MTLLRPGANQKQRIRQSRKLFSEATVRTDGRKTTKLPTTVDDELAIKTASQPTKSQTHIGGKFTAAECVSCHGYESCRVPRSVGS